MLKPIRIFHGVLFLIFVVFLFWHEKKDILSDNEISEYIKKIKYNISIKKENQLHQEDQKSYFIILLNKLGSLTEPDD